jgi:hypothetical protein
MVMTFAEHAPGMMERRFPIAVVTVGLALGLAAG